jgi:aryl carrier-like protein
MLTALPITASGKIDRRALPAPEALGRADFAEGIEPRDEEERRVAEIWKQVLKIPRVGVHENFFDLGGHSLAAMQVASRLREAARVEVHFVDIFERPTIAALAETLRQTRPEEVAP